MTHSAILFGAIGTLAETSELQRRAYNLSFAAHDLDWVWEAATYYRMLRQPGGADRVARYAAAAGDTVDAAKVHALKERIFDGLALRHGIEVRTGVEAVLADCRAANIPTAFCTTTSAAQVETILEAAGPALSRGDFDWIGTRDMVQRGKPAPDIYVAALRALGVSAGDALAIEDTPESAEAALAAGITVLGFPGHAARGRAFPRGVRVVDDLAQVLRQSASGIAAE